MEGPLYSQERGSGGEFEETVYSFLNLSWSPFFSYFCLLQWAYSTLLAPQVPVALPLLQVPLMLKSVPVSL